MEGSLRKPSIFWIIFVLISFALLWENNTIDKNKLACFSTHYFPLEFPRLNLIWPTELVSSISLPCRMNVTIQTSVCCLVLPFVSVFVNWKVWSASSLCLLLLLLQIVNSLWLEPLALVGL